MNRTVKELEYFQAWHAKQQKVRMAMAAETHRPRSAEVNRAIAEAHRLAAEAIAGVVARVAHAQDGTVVVPVRVD